MNHTDWSELAEEWWKFYASREYLPGGFAWTGFDYRGEPTPYGWPSINSQFGIVDLCGFPKDNFYYYQAWWGREPVLHLFPHWNWEQRLGEPVSVWVHSNLEEVELFLNGRSQGRKKVEPLTHLEWQVKYEPGAIEAHGIKDGKVVMTSRRETTGAPATIRLSADRSEIAADGADIALVRVEVLDSAGRARADGRQSDQVQSQRRGDAAGCRQRRSQLSGIRQTAAAQSLQWPGAAHRSGHHHAGCNHDRSLHGGLPGPEAPHDPNIDHHPQSAPASGAAVNRTQAVVSV